MRARVMCRVAVIMASLGLLCCGKAAAAGEHLFQAMGMATLPTSPAQGFTLPDLKGNQVALQDYRGKLVFLNFWATWCIPCREEMPAMEQLHQRFGSQGLAIVATNHQENLEQVKAFVDQRRLSFQAWLTDKSEACPSPLLRSVYTLFGTTGFQGGLTWRARLVSMIRWCTS
jgi:thiol-disulfide isomerase/thioredoxin